MGKVEIIELKANVLEDNDKLAGETRKRLKKEKTFLLNLMSSPGAGKTTTLLQTAKKMGISNGNPNVNPNGIYAGISVGVMEADIDSDVDALKLQEAGVRTVQLHTGGMCHLDAAMTNQGLDSIQTADLDLVILENVGNLVCPAEFDTGACKNACIVSVPEGDDKPLKYPLMFQVADIVLVNKMDVADYFDFDLENFRKYVEMRHPGIPVIPYSAKTGEGMEAWTEWLLKEVQAWNQENTTI